MSRGAPFTGLGRHFADWAARQSTGEPELAARMAGLAIEALQAGHVCLEADAAGLDAERLFATGLVGHAGECAAPFVLDAAGRLYLFRYWDHEAALARRLAVLDRAAPVANADAIGTAVGRLFGPLAGDARDRQREVAMALASRGLVVVSGGPGTGKTWTVANALAVLAECWPGDLPPRIGLAAPTGRAAARLDESLNTAWPDAARAPRAARARPAGAQTLHRLLGMRRDGRASFDPCRPLPLDVVVVDEASMLDLALARRLAEALADDARLILLGDRDQLASVEAGAVLAEICAAAGRGGPLYGAMIELTHRFRFGAESPISALADAVRAGAADAALASLGSGNPALTLVPAEQTGALLGTYAQELAQAIGRGSPGEVARLLDRERLIAVVREGPWGVTRIGAEVARLTATRGGHGEPLLVRANDPAQGLFNGDLGIRWHAGPESGPPKVWFDGERWFAAERIPAHEPGYVLTVHRSQGAEFDGVTLILPGSEVLLATRELVYTAVTRARSRVRIVGSRERLAAAVARRFERRSGLASRIAAARGQT
ncbi:MAG: exodeoxyribonuclease V subunit alpha [Chromatiales bacterium]|nr:exodeoxyribonuclease V subunit alpha [Chromatiales bacterium]